MKTYIVNYVSEACTGGLLIESGAFSTIARAEKFIEDRTRGLYERRGPMLWRDPDSNSFYEIQVVLVDETNFL